MTVALGHRTGGGGGRQMSEASPATRVPHDEVTRKRTSPDVVTSTVCKSCSAPEFFVSSNRDVHYLVHLSPVPPLDPSSFHGPAAMATRPSRGPPMEQLECRNGDGSGTFHSERTESLSEYGAEGTCFASVPLILAASLVVLASFHILRENPRKACPNAAGWAEVVGMARAQALAVFDRAWPYLWRSHVQTINRPS